MKKVKQILLIFIAFKITVLLAYLLYKHLPLQLLHFEHQATEDIQFNDIYYATKLFKNSELEDKEVVLINTGSINNDGLFRKKLADLINKVAEKKPKKIGLDIYFSTRKESSIDSALSEAILKNDIITVVDFKSKSKNIFSFNNKSLMNLPGKNEESKREYYNYQIIDKDTIPSFAAKLSNTKSKDTVSYLKYCTEDKGYFNILNKNEKINPINFPAIEASDFFDKKNQNQIREIIKNKIVIIGHLGTGNMHNPYDVEDKFRVPTDKTLFNRNLTMPGSVIHANAVQMMKNKDNVIIIDGWSFEIISSLLLICFLVLFNFINHRYHLGKLFNVLIILGTTIPIIYISCVYLMDVGIYFKIGGLFAQIVFLEEFIEIYEGFEKKFNKNNKHEKN